MFLEISQNSKENTCARASFLTPFFQNTSGWLLPYFLNKWFDMFLRFRFRLQLECKIYRFISPEAYSEHSWTSKMKLSAKIVICELFCQKNCVCKSMGWFLCDRDLCHERLGFHQQRLIQNPVSRHVKCSLLQ